MNKKKWLGTLKFLAAYLVAAWTFLQFVDWVLNRYNVSPYWVDLLLWVFIGIIPSLLIYFYHRERLNQLKLLRREKILFPLNIILILAVTYFGFGNSDLGATTKDIKYTDQDGKPQSKTITKEEFRIGIPIYQFENLNSNDSTEWWRQGISKLLVYDLEQNKSLTPIYGLNNETADKIRDASLFYDFYVDGSYSIKEDTITVEVFIRKASNAKILNKKTFKGNDLLNILDDASIYITENVGFVETNRINYLDLPLKSFISESNNAVKEFIEGDYYRAIDYDSTFAMAYLENARQNRIFSRSSMETKELTDKAYKNREKLPLQKQLEVIIERSLAYKDFESAEEQVKLQLEVDPNNFSYNDILYNIYSKNRKLENYLKHAEDRFSTDPNLFNGSRLMIALMVNHEDEKLINYIEKFEIINPMLRIYKLNPLLFQGKVNEADDLFNDIKTTYPQYKNTFLPFEATIDYLKSNETDTNNLKPFIGIFRSNEKEQRLDLWMFKDRILQQIENQPAMPFFQAGDDVLIGGIIGGTILKAELVKDKNDQTIGLLVTQYRDRDTMNLWYWKEDKYIQKAHESLNKGDLEEALSLYTIAYQENPQHVYLKNIIAHITYMQSLDAETLIEQYAAHSGTYGPRNFYVDNGKFYYKYKDAESELFKVQLLPISENSYLDLTRLGYIMTFEENESGKSISKSMKYAIGDEIKFDWILERNQDGTDHFAKND